METSSKHTYYYNSITTPTFKDDFYIVFIFDIFVFIFTYIAKEM